MNNDQTARSQSQAATISRPDLRRLTSLFTASADKDRELLLYTFLQHSIGLLNAAGAIFFVDQDRHLSSAATLLSRQAQSWTTDMEKQLAGAAQKAIASGHAHSQALADQPAVCILACPTDISNKQQACLTFVLLPGDAAIESFLVIAQLLAGLLSQQLSASAAQSGSADGLPAALGRLLAEVLAADNRQTGLLRLTAGLRSCVGCSRVAVGTGPAAGGMRLSTLSDVTSLNRQTEQGRIMEKGLNECIVQGRILCWPAPENDIESPILQEVARSTDSNCVVGIPLANPAGGRQAALLFLWQKQPDKAGLRDIVTGLGQMSDLLAVSLHMLLHGGKMTGRTALARHGRLHRLLLTGMPVLAVLLLFLVPVPYRITAASLAKPVTTRYVVAHVDTILDKVLVEPGDRVQAGATLARLDGREITMQLASLVAERDKAARMRDQYLAEGNTPAAQIARLDEQRYTQQINLLHERQQHLLLTSPVNGIVLTGDLKRAEGSPVSKGQTLFEVAPLDRMNIELAIREQDIARVRPGIPASIRFDAYPHQRWLGTIQRIIPKSQLRDMHNVFIAELEFDNPDKRLRPGMRGQAEIDCGRRSLAWILFHRPWYTLLRLIDQFF